MKQEAKILASESKIDTVLDIVDENREKKLPTFDLSYFNGRVYFDNDGSQNCFVFKLLFKNFRIPTDDTETIKALKLK